MKKDLIIGCFTNYDWNKIKFWANSIDKSGFVGDKAMVIYNSDFATVNNLVKQKFMLYAFKQDNNRQMFFYPDQFVIVVQRFLDLYNFMGQLDLTQYRYVIHTDVKDVVFQTNPSDWLSANMGDAKILASCESLAYQHEPWGNENLYYSYPMVYEKLKTKPIWNCGVQAGEIETMRDLWLNIYLLCKGSPMPNPDQAAYNLLLNSEPYRSITKFAMSEDGWACQSGTTVDPAKIEQFKPYLLEAQPIWLNNTACTSKGVQHAVLHQYDRIPEWKAIIESRFA
jgi:hypothetical protein